MISTSISIVLLNFGEPTSSDLSEITAFLERIFMANASIERPADEAAARARSRELAVRRAPKLAEEYASIGGSPLNSQAEEQARALQSELEARGLPSRTHVGMQFTEPTIEQAVRRAGADGASTLIGLPVYPLCGPSTTVRALEEFREATTSLSQVEVREVSGWHRHPAYVRFRADAIRDLLSARSIDLADPTVRLVFSAHGTPLRYVEAGSRYLDYVEDWCDAVARELGAPRFELGYQNHANRGVAWSAPDIDAVVEGLAGEARRIVVDPVSFMHEQSETLAELDHELREVAESAGLEFHRVPIAHAHPAFVSVLADLVEASLGGEGLELTPCRCRPGADVCLNGQVPNL